MLTKEEIEAKLKGVDPKLCAIFAARCSLRVLPLLIEKNTEINFSYWKKENRSIYLQILLTAQRYALNLFHLVNNDSDRLRKSIYSSSAETVANFTNYRSAALITAHAAELAYATEYKNNKSDIIFHIFEISQTIQNSIENPAVSPFIKNAFASDWTLLKNSLLNRLIGKTYYKPSPLVSLPLWPDGIPDDWQQLYQQFKQAVLDLDEGFEHWLDWYEDRVKGVPLDPEVEAKWFSIPEEVKAQGAKATNAYFKDLFESASSPLNLVRAIFIGDGAVGKTSLIRRLHGEPVIEGSEAMTAGIEIKQWALPNSAIKARFWDFGGQVMSHSMHRFFLRERCLYILLVDAGSERDKRERLTANDRAEYWLEHIKAFGNAAPVMLVGNKADKASVNLDMNALREKYPNILDFYPISCTSTELSYRNRFQTFHDDLVTQLKQVDTHQVMFTDKQFAMLKNLRERSRNSAFLDYEAFDTLCIEHEIGKVGLDKTAFLGLLDALGEIVHFPDLAWSEAYVLNPRWLTYGVYTLLYAAKTEQQLGLLSDNDVRNILQAEQVTDELGNVLTYPTAKCRFIVDAMSRFGLCYEMHDKTQVAQKRLVIPDKLPKNQPDLRGYFQETPDTIAFEFDFDGLLPRSLMPNLIVSRHTEIAEDQHGKQLVWQQGVILKSQLYQATARLQVDYRQRRLSLWVQGKQLRDYLAVLRNEIYRLLEPIKGLVFSENVVLPAFARIDQSPFNTHREQREKAPYNRLIKEAARGLKTTTSDAGIDYDLQQVMGFIMTTEKQQQETANVTNQTINVNAPVGAIGGTGHHQRVSGQVVINHNDKRLLTDFQQALTDLMKQVQNHDADFEIKANAYSELKQIREQLAKLETASPEAKSQLSQLLSNMKDGTLGAIALGKDIKEASETVSWLMTTAASVSALLATLPL